MSEEPARNLGAQEFEAVTFLWLEGRRPRLGTPHPGKRDLLGASEWPTLFREWLQ